MKNVFNRIVERIMEFIRKRDLFCIIGECIIIAIMSAMFYQIAFGLDEEPCEVVIESSQEAISNIEKLIQPEETEAVQITETETEEETNIAEEVAMDDFELLAQLVEAEAGGEEFQGMRYVVDVVLNRVDSPDFPNTISEVIFQPYQFSCVLDGGLERAGYRMHAECYDAVMMELEHRSNTEITFFTAGNYNPYCEPCFKYGNHYFGKGKS